MVLPANYGVERETQTSTGRSHSVKDILNLKFMRNDTVKIHHGTIATVDVDSRRPGENVGVETDRFGVDCRLVRAE